MPCEFGLKTVGKSRATIFGLVDLKHVCFLIPFSGKRLP